MNACSRARRGEGVTLVEIVFVVAILATVAAVILPMLARSQEEPRRIRCRNNLNQLAKGMATYLNEFGDDRWYPCPLGRGRDPRTYNGAEWLASLYWSGVIPDPGVFICPCSPDTNDNWERGVAAWGEHLGSSHAAASFGSQTVSYAGMHYYSQTNEAGQPIPGAVREDFPPDRPMASDDTQGDINHGTADNGGMNILFFDSHVEFRTNTELDLDRAVGQKGGLLWQLRN